jgi:hypothetical protein
VELIELAVVCYRTYTNPTCIFGTLDGGQQTDDGGIRLPSFVFRPIVMGASDVL